jgi:UDP-N-acetylmuramyl tripeptide synthase
LNKNKTIWDIVNLETNKTGNTEKINNLNTDGNLISDHQDIENAFNKYFLTKVKSINTKQNEHSSHNSDNTNPLHYLMQSFKNPFPNIHLKSISTKEVQTIIKSLKPKNSSGYNGIFTKLLKISSPFISSPLTHIRM